MLRNRKELQVSFPQGPQAGITWETSKYSTKQFRGQWGGWAPRGGKFTKETLFQGGLEERTAEAGNLVGQRSEVPHGERVRDGREVPLGEHISYESGAQLHPVQLLPSRRAVWLPHLWSGARNPAWQAAGRIPILEKYAIRGDARCHFDGPLANQSLNKSILSPCYAH